LLFRDIKKIKIYFTTRFFCVFNKQHIKENEMKIYKENFWIFVWDFFRIFSLNSEVLEGVGNYFSFLMIFTKFPFLNCQNFLFQTVKIFIFKLSKFFFSNCQNFSFQTVKISLYKLSKFSFSNCQNFPFQTVKIFLFQEYEEKLVFVSQNFWFWISVSPLKSLERTDL
jgi:hypothetical protein